MIKQFDAVVIGAGVSGLYALYKLREAGLSARAFEAGDGVGGTWYWNRYPGARFDSESYSYQYSFSRELIEEWDWSEEFVGQPEIERYLNHVADKFDLRRDVEFSARVQSVTWDDAAQLWNLRTEDGRAARARFVLAATGFMSAHQYPDIAGRDDFAGIGVHTARWPREGIELSGKRVAVIGSGATAVQIIQTIAPEVGHLAVFQRTANWCTPLRNHAIAPAAQRDLKRRAQDVFDLCNETYAGFIHKFDPRKGSELSREARWAHYEQLYQRGGFALWLANFAEVFTDREMAAEVSEFLAAKIRARVRDPRIAEKLVPTDHLFGTKRPPGEKDYYEAFNLDHVELVDLRETPIERIVPAGIETRDDGATRLHEFDVIVYATGFRAMTGELMRIDIVGRDGLNLNDKWADGPLTNLGVQFAGFPNFFAILGPHNPAAFCNITRCVESNVDWIVGCIEHLRAGGHSTVEANAAAEQAWTQRCYDSASGFLFADVRNSWFFGYHNDGGEQGRFLVFTEGVPAYRRIFAEAAASGYAGFEFN
ncbi:MAG: NAD(P)/FAD-dependent oxidoreductase [Gammaproteobacteria bacterium]|nr:NAD(P)/FAD-dependent oxidoreductase [Gammaproteobacteria bacterium]